MLVPLPDGHLRLLLLINGVAHYFLATVLPTAPLAVIVVSPLARLRGRVFNGRREMRFDLRVIDGDALPKSLVLSHFVAFAVVESFPHHYLGPIRRASSGIITNDDAVLTAAAAASSASCQHEPWSAFPTLLSVYLVHLKLPARIAAPTPAEVLLANHIAVILDNDPFCGSVPSPHVQNHVRSFPFYADALDGWGPNGWSPWVKRQAQFFGRWAVVCYERDTHRQLQLSRWHQYGEPRLVSLRFHSRSAFVHGDVARDRLRAEAMDDFARQLAVAVATGGSGVALAARLGRRQPDSPPQTHPSTPPLVGVPQPPPPPLRRRSSTPSEPHRVLDDDDDDDDASIGAAAAAAAAGGDDNDNDGGGGDDDDDDTERSNAEEQRLRDSPAEIGDNVDLEAAIRISVSPAVVQQLWRTSTFLTLRGANYMWLLDREHRQADRVVLFDPLHPIRVEWRHTARPPLSVAEVAVGLPLQVPEPHDD